MRVTLIKKDRLRNINLPDNPSGSFWITDYDENGKESNIINIVAENNSWNLISNNEIKCVVNNTFEKKITLKNYSFYMLNNLYNNENYLVYTSDSYDNKPKEFLIAPNEGQLISIGNSMCNVCMQNLEANHARLIIENGKCVIYPSSSSAGIYVNNIRVYEKKVLEFGDLIFINGLKILFSKHGNFYKLSFYYHDNSLSIQGLSYFNNNSEEDGFSEEDEDIDVKWYQEDDYFHKTPRFKPNIEEKELVIDPPPVKEQEPNTPVLLTVGPMLTMSMSSMVMAFVSISNLKNGNGSLISALPSIVMAFAMLLSTLLWPSITRRYEKKLARKKEQDRINKYSVYMDSRRNIILQELQDQTNLLNISYPNLYECSRVILDKKDELWCKRIEDDDFLKVNLGCGNYPLKLKITYPEEHFTMIEDELKEIANKLSREPKILKNVPVPYSFLDNNISSIVGNYNDRVDYFKKILLQIVAFHGYTDLKIVILTDNDKKNNWSTIKNLPHCFSDDKNVRFFASNKEEYSMLSSYFEKVLQIRKDALNGKEVNPHVFDKIYLIVTDSFKLVRRNDFINDLLDEKQNYGFSFIILNKNISTLPEQCKSFIKVNMTNGELSKNVINADSQPFINDLATGIDYNECYKKLSNIPIETSDNSASKIPDKLGFLEMYDVGKVEQLNSLNRWKKSNPMETLKAPVGEGKNDEIQYIDLHEKAHGPHGLIAGMTGSGKSEFIISYILSLAVNYHPYEVQFILIDYKGGGLAGAFENANSGKKLPHLVGVITNLDKSEIKRTLSSIESELKRRQKLFNLARNKTGESTVDIYKYQRLYREGKVDEAVSHLFIISDEFAELKTQEPEFMEQLISTARIGRSLGVHLILATQKPSGVVDPQIWSNTRFRVCLRVQDKGDSNEVIKCPDAAYLKEAGRFYFQVGYNEVFTLGQAAWAGGKYVPAEKTNKQIDTSIEFINNVGQVIRKVETKEKKEVKQVKNLGEELSNVVNYLYDIADSENIKCKPLWLEKMPSFINVNNLIKKYAFKQSNYELNIPIGEYDIPTEQRQELLTVNFTNNGNTLVYGAAGSGKENFIMTMIYSSMKLYEPSDVNYYIMDFGAEVLKAYSNSIYVGDIIGLGDDDKIKNLYKLINSEIERRKVLFSNYGGSYTDYLKKNNNKIPRLVIVLNNYEAYQDSYEVYTDTLNTLTRDCSKFGIYFIMTCNTPNGMRFKLKQNFSNIFCLNQNNEDDYSAILGNVNKNYPSKNFGRGIIKGNMVYEFQTASVDVKEKINDTIDEIIDEVKDKYKYKAKKIPTLPKVVDYEYVREYIDNTLNMVIGVEKNSLDIYKYNFKKNFIDVISASDSSLLSRFANSFIAQLKLVKNISIITIAAEDYDIDSNLRSGMVYEENNLNDIYDKFKNYVDECYKIFESNNFNQASLMNQTPIMLVINGLESFKSKLSDENKGSINDCFKKAKQIGIVNVFIFDSIDNVKKSEFEPWFKEGFNANDGIWIGNGFNDQFTFKSLIRSPELKEMIGDDFCIVLQKGRPSIVKYISDFNIKNLDEDDFIEEL